MRFAVALIRAMGAGWRNSLAPREPGMAESNGKDIGHSSDLPLIIRPFKLRHYRIGVEAHLNTTEDALRLEATVGEMKF